MATQTEQINDLITAATALKTTFETKDAAIDASVAAVVADAQSISNAKAQADLDAASVAADKTQADTDAAAIATAIADINAAIDPKLPMLNLLPDGGRFVSAATKPYAHFLGGGFDASRSHFQSFNGSTIEEGGRFYHNNSTNGGSGGVLTQPVIDLLAAMGRVGSEATYGPDFFIAKMTAGSGTIASNISGNYIMNAVGSFGKLLGYHRDLSVAVWARCTAGTVYVGDANLLVDGVAAGDHHELTVAEGWVHLAASGRAGLGYNSHPIPAFYGSDGAIVEIALPVVVPCLIDLAPHYQPLTPYYET